MARKNLTLGGRRAAAAILENLEQTENSLAEQPEQEGTEPTGQEPAVVAQSEARQSKQAYRDPQTGIILMTGTRSKRGDKALKERRTERLNMLLPPSVAEWIRSITAQSRYSVNDAGIEAFQLWAIAKGLPQYEPPED